MTKKQGFVELKIRVIATEIGGLSRENEVIDMSENLSEEFKDEIWDEFSIDLDAFSRKIKLSKLKRGRKGKQKKEASKKMATEDIKATFLCTSFTYTCGCNESKNSIKICKSHFEEMNEFLKTKGFTKENAQYFWGIMGTERQKPSVCKTKQEGE